MKKLSILFLLSIFSLSSFAQQKQKSSLTIALGPSFPVGDFADKDFAEEASGLAKTGIFAAITYGYQFSKVVGFAAGVRGSIHGIDMSSFQVPSGVGATSKIETTTWRTASILGGLTQSLPLTTSGKLTMEFHELMGVQFSSSPKTDIEVFLPGVGNLSASQNSDHATSFALNFSAGLKYKLDGNIGVKLHADYDTSKANFPGIPVSSGGATSFQQSSQKFQSIGVGLGLTIGF